jgi:hypothetical protein
MIDFLDPETLFIIEEVAKFSRTTDTSHVPPDIMDLAYDRMFNWEARND